jgi:hypothetical protein
MAQGETVRKAREGCGVAAVQWTGITKYRFQSECALVADIYLALALPPSLNRGILRTVIIL